MNRLLTPKQIATSIGVSESSLKRWCDQGVLTTVRTPGGHRRVRSGEVIRFLREQQYALVRPEAIGLPTGLGAGSAAAGSARNALFDAVSRGDAESIRRVVIETYLKGGPVVRVCQDLVTPVLHAIGDQWECGALEVYQERQGCEVLGRALYELKTLLPEPDPSAPVAIGGTPAGDHYRLATQMIELALQEAGWRATSLGSSLPFETLAAAAERRRPRLFWLSLSYVDDREATKAGFQHFIRSAPANTAVAVGGREAGDWLVDPSDESRARLFDDFSSLVKHAGKLAAAEARP